MLITEEFDHHGYLLAYSNLKLFNKYLLDIKTYEGEEGENYGLSIFFPEDWIEREERIDKRCSRFFFKSKYQDAVKYALINHTMDTYDQINQKMQSTITRAMYTSSNFDRSQDTILIEVHSYLSNALNTLENENISYETISEDTVSLSSPNLSSLTKVSGQLLSHVIDNIVSVSSEAYFKTRSEFVVNDEYREIIQVLDKIEKDVDELKYLRLKLHTIKKDTRFQKIKHIEEFGLTKDIALRLENLQINTEELLDFIVLDKLY